MAREAEGRMPSNIRVGTANVRRTKGGVLATVVLARQDAEQTTPIHTGDFKLGDEVARTRWIKAAVTAAKDLGVTVPATALRQELVSRHAEAEAETDHPPARTEPAKAGEYEERNGCLIRWKPTPDGGSAPLTLTNFVGRIIRDVMQDDGAETRRIFDIEAAVVNGPRRTFAVSADRFMAMTWAVEHLGAGAVIQAGVSARDHARAAIQTLSGTEIPTTVVYAHTGWREIDGQWVYLDVDGAIGADGRIEGVAVDLPPEISRYRLEVPADQEAAQIAVWAHLRMLSVAPKRITAPAFAASVRAVLGQADMAGFLVGKTGAGKSEIAALAQQSFGREMDRRHLPLTWLATGNSAEAVAFAAKDALLVIDDFCPVGNLADVQRMHREADRIFRAQGNSAGRTRMRSDGTLRPARPPRGVILSTGEDLPRGQSLQARLFVAEVRGELGKPGADIDAGMLTRCQAEAGEGLYAQAMGGYVRWLAPRYGTIRRTLGRWRRKLRERSGSAAHARTPDQVADLMLGLLYYLRYARSVGALTRIDAHGEWWQAWDALTQVAAAQAGLQEAVDPPARFFAMLGAAIASGEAHLASPDGGAPDNPGAWGWRQPESSVEWSPQGRRVGWVGSTAEYGPVAWLEPEASFRAAQAMGIGTGEALTISSRMLLRHMRDKGMLLRMDTARQVLTARKRDLEGKRRDVIWIAQALIYPEEPDPPDPEGIRT